MRVSTNITKNNYEIIIDGKPFRVTYPREISLEPPFNKPILQNIAFSQTWPFSFIGRVSYDFGQVFFKKLILKTCYNDTPVIAEENKLDTREFQERYKNSITNIYFKNESAKSTIFEEGFSDSDSAILLLSFGKDSLLSFGLANELGLNVSVFFNSDTIGHEHEFNKKKELAKRFEKEFKVKVYNIDDCTDLIKDPDNTKYIQDLQGSALVLYYSLLALPLSYKEKAKYIIVGNEQNFNDPFVNKDGFKAYVTADQTVKFMEEANSLLEKFTNKNQRLLSLIEPIYNLFEMKILYSRYPNLLKYTMSCSNEKLKKGQWCYKCPMCAKAFLYAIAVNGNSSQMNFHQNLFNREFAALYPLFNKNPTRIYEKPPKVRDEQLLAFYLAYKNKARGYLIDKFRKLYLEEAEERYDELHNTFFGIHPGFTMPTDIKQKVNSIYKEELNRI